MGTGNLAGCSLYRIQISQRRVSPPRPPGLPGVGPGHQGGGVGQQGGEEGGGGEAAAQLALRPAEDTYDGSHLEIPPSPN